MSYVVRADVEAIIPPQFVTEALDDDGDGMEDEGLFAALAESVDTEIDGQLSRRYSLPLVNPPASLRSGAKSLLCEALYQRRGISADMNPFAKAAADFRAWLREIATGGAQLVVGTAPAKPPISVISESAGTVPRNRLNG
jgi:phage gp36-like protein